MVLNGIEILPGEEKQVNINVSRLPTRTSIDIPIIVNRAVEDGPTLLLMAGMHGDEINGVETIRRFMAKKYNVPDKGTVICVPIINIYGFIHFSREVPDGKDVNRSFPGSKTGSLAGLIAHFLTNELLPIVDLGIDYHTGGARINNYPQIRAQLDRGANSELAAVFNAPYTINSKFREKSFRKEADRQGVPILVYEGGESLRLKKHAIEEGIDGALRIMKHLGMRSDAPVAEKVPVVIIKSSWVRARSSGLFSCYVKPGDHVKKGQKLGLIASPYGEYEKIFKATANGEIVAVNNNPVVNKGDALIHFGIESQ